MLGTPVNKRVEVTTTLMNRFTAYFGPVYDLGGAVLRQQVDTDSVVRYGRFRIEGGDRVRTAILVSRDPTACDNSFVRVRLYAYIFTKLGLTSFPLNTVHAFSGSQRQLS